MHQEDQRTFPLHSLEDSSEDGSVGAQPKRARLTRGTIDEECANESDNIGENVSEFDDSDANDDVTDGDESDPVVLLNKVISFGRKLANGRSIEQDATRDADRNAIIKMSQIRVFLNDNGFSPRRRPPKNLSQEEIDKERCMYNWICDVRKRTRITLHGQGSIQHESTYHRPRRI
eukprot:scaffold1772_cov34-Cyclotella_meneghiniana.AAC.5